MAVKGSATVSHFRTGDIHIVQWDYATEDATGKLEDAGSVGGLNGEVLGLRFLPAVTDPVDDNYDLLVLVEGDGGVLVEWDLVLGLALNMPGGANKAVQNICPLSRGFDGTNENPQRLWLADDTITLQSGTIIGTSTDIGSAGIAYGSVFLLLRDPIFQGRFR